MITAGRLFTACSSASAAEAAVATFAPSRLNIALKSVNVSIESFTLIARDPPAESP